MESFIFSEMNKASRSKDSSKIKYYGPFASALGYVIHCGNKRSQSQRESTRVRNATSSLTIYRGIALPLPELHTKFQPGTKITL